MMFIVVDFPAPFGPSSPHITPLSTENDRSSTAETVPYRLLMRSTSIKKSSFLSISRAPRGMASNTMPIECGTAAHSRKKGKDGAGTRRASSWRRQRRKQALTETHPLKTFTESVMLFHREAERRRATEGGAQAPRNTLR